MTVQPASPPLAKRSIATTAPDRDRLLQTSRRVDWRFLLPSGELSDCLYLGRQEATLVEALALHCPSFELLGDANDTFGSKFPLVVGKDLTRRELHDAIEAVASGGWLYVELTRRRSKGRSTALATSQSQGKAIRSLRFVLRTMTKAGLVEPQVHWHWPTFESCVEIVPLHDRSALQCAVRRRGTGLISRLKTTLAILSIRLGWLQSIVPHVSVLVRREPIPHPLGNR